jgi:hypothetical protein
MDAKNLALLISGAGMLGAILVGYLQLRYGFHVFQMGQGSTPARTKMKFGKWWLDTSSTGVAVMGLASCWAVAAVMMRPTLTNTSSESYSVASASGGVIGPTQLAATAPDQDSWKVWATKLDTLDQTLADAFVRSSLSEGKAHSFDLGDLRITASPTCTILSVPLRSDKNSRFVYYVPVGAGDNSLTFVPVSLRHSDLKMAGAIDSKAQLAKPNH